MLPIINSPVKGRKVWGGLVPYGEVWRTGANKATEIRFGRDVKLGGKDVPAGAVVAGNPARILRYKDGYGPGA